MTHESMKTIRADEARRIFGVAGEGIVWAVLSGGIHRNHIHFKQHENLILPPPLHHADFSVPELAENVREQEALVDPHGNGTHDAGIICGESWDADWGTHRLGVAPRCKLLSLKVFDDAGKSDERTILAALERIKSVNLAANKLIIHGLAVNLSIAWDADSFPCGPVCEAVNDLVRSGVVVVVPAGDFGYGSRESGSAQAAAEATPRANALAPVWGSISDPGNAELAITVGATHRRDPHDFGASYFSSRGPTSDGRLKPDLLAPGQKITSCWVDPEPPHKRVENELRENPQSCKATYDATEHRPQSPMSQVRLRSCCRPGPS
jgi:serine protease AprX